MTKPSPAEQWLSDLGTGDSSASDRMASCLTEGLLAVGRGSENNGARFLVIMKVMAIQLAALRSLGPEQAALADQWLAMMPDALAGEMDRFDVVVRRDKALTEAVRHGH